MTINKRMIFYVRNEEIFKKLKAENKRSDIFNMLVEDYYSQDLEYLKQKEQESLEQLEFIKLKIKNKEDQNQLIKEQRDKENQITQESEERKKFNSDLVTLWREEKITDKIYYKICDIKDLKDKIKELKKYI